MKNISLRIITFYLAFCVPVLISQPCSSQTSGKTTPNGSLWSSSSRGLAADCRAHKVGDPITIMVQESSTASSTASTKTSKSESYAFNGLTGGLHGLLGPLGSSDSSSLDGSGQTSRSGSLITTMSAVVKKVLPNGDLMIQGTRLITVNKEKENIVLTGEVRPQDISPNNTVSSVSLANATITYQGKGPVSKQTHGGLLSRLFGWLF